MTVKDLHNNNNFILVGASIIAGLPRALRAPYPWNIVNLFSFGCHMTDQAYVRTYIRKRLQIVRVG